MSANQLQMEVKDQAALMEDFDKVLKKTLIPSKMRESLVGKLFVLQGSFLVILIP